MPTGRLFDLSGKTALVTGASTGLGYAMARGLLAAGARVLIAGRRSDVLIEACATLRHEVRSSEVLFDTVDLYDRGSVDAFAARAIDLTGGIDIFVGNAGALHAESFGGITHREADRVIQLHLTANISLTQAFVPHMRSKRWGRIIFSSSTASALAAPMQGNIVYAASKSGVNAFGRALAADLGRFGITVNSIILGVFWTAILRDAVDELRTKQGAAAADTMIDKFTQMTALGRLGDPEDLDGLIQLLASDAGRYITGASIPIDGGTSIMMTPFPAS